MKTILVATDFSPAALHAAGYAADMALAIDAALYLLHVYQVPLSYGDAPAIISLADVEQLAEMDMKEFKDVLAGNKAGKPIIKTELRLGSFYKELETVCETIKPYAVVMGCQGTTAAERLFFGSHTVHAIRHLEWPLIAVPAGAVYSSIKKIGLACDFDEVADTVPADEIKMLVKDLHAELHVLNTGNEKVYNPDIVFESGILQKMLKDLNPGYHFIANEDTDAGILEFTEVNRIDLLIVLPKRHGLIDRLLHKSHSKHLVLYSHIPVMALHH